mmetsp:Transcript_96400/g.251234  ORF Transcript_96400/g.251234 Transcript_96400/m.251234 type:complete len:205 (-) Transcript_96400:478-1092(-)
MHFRAGFLPFGFGPVWSHLGLRVRVVHVKVWPALGNGPRQKYPGRLRQACAQQRTHPLRADSHPGRLDQRGPSRLQGRAREADLGRPGAPGAGRQPSGGVVEGRARAAGGGVRGVRRRAELGEPLEVGCRPGGQGRWRCQAPVAHALFPPVGVHAHGRAVGTHPCRCSRRRERPVCHLLRPGAPALPRAQRLHRAARQFDAVAP